jgi:hypothetical protein
MSFLPSTDPWPICVLAVAGILMGLTSLLARRRRNQRPAWQVPVLIAVFLALAGAGAFAADLPEMVWQPALVLAGVWLAFGLGRLGFLEKVARGLSQPRVQAGILILSSGLLLAWQGYEINRQEAQELAESEARMAAVAPPPNFVSVESCSALTDAGTPIPVFLIGPGSAPQPNSTTEENRISQRRLNHKLIQMGPATDDSNCHGWVFTGGRYWVPGNSVDRILKDNGYRVVSQPAGGDLAVFRNQGGEITHTGVVHSVGGDGVVLVESKWGRLGRYIHTCADHIYDDNSCGYYRSSRSGHVLRGIEGVRPEYAPVSAISKEAAVEKIEGKDASAPKEPKSNHSCLCRKSYTQMQWRLWALRRQRQAETVGQRFGFPTVPSQFTWRNGATSQTPGRSSIQSPPNSNPANRAAGSKSAPRFFFQPPPSDPNRACGQWDYRKQI